MKNSMMFLESSALDGQNIDEAFDLMVAGSRVLS